MLFESAKNLRIAVLSTFFSNGGQCAGVLFDAFDDFFVQSFGFNLFLELCQKKVAVMGNCFIYSFGIFIIKPGNYVLMKNEYIRQRRYYVKGCGENMRGNGFI